MRIQDAVLDALEKNRGEYLSGEQLASSLGVSRNAVWKAIQKLEEAGHKIRAVPKRGYTLAPESDVLTVQSVSRFLDTDMPVYLQVQTEVTSTNTLLKVQAEQGAPEGTVLIAESRRQARAGSADTSRRRRVQVFISACCSARAAPLKNRFSSRLPQRSPCAKPLSRSRG